MNVGNCCSSFCCMDVIDDELSIMNRISMLLFIFCVTVAVSVAVGSMMPARAFATCTPKRRAPRRPIPPSEARASSASGTTFELHEESWRSS